MIPTKKFTTGVALLIAICNTISGYAQDTRTIIESGVSLALAKHRHAVISNLQYTLDLDIPADKTRILKHQNPLILL